MKRELLEVVMMAAGIRTFMPPQKRMVRVVDKPQHTQNLFGPIDEVAGKEWEVVSRNPEGDCLCIFHGSKGTNLVDVDHRDISQNIQIQ